MDWTGGTRRRFAAGKNNSMLQRQKAHFAKARTRGTDDTHGQSGCPLWPEHGTSQAHSGGPKSHRVSRPRHKHSHHHGNKAHAANEHRRQLRSLNRSSELSTVSEGERVHGKPHRRDPAESQSRVVLQHASTSRHSSSRHRDLAGAATEQDLLLANRKRLLARTDWLGLEAARPVHMRFPSASDKDRVGKRRKVDRPDRRAKPAGARLLTPLFEERIGAPQYLMSGALPADSIRVKVGTDALATLTQHSRRSHTSHGSSTKSHPLSEESMLLGDEDGTLNFWPHAAMQHPDKSRDLMPSASMAVFAGSHVTTGMKYAQQSSEMRLLSSVGGDSISSDQDLAVSSVANAEPQHAGFPDSDAQFDRAESHTETGGSVMKNASLQSSEAQQASTPQPVGVAVEDRPPTGGYTAGGSEYGDDGDENQMWRKLMNIDQLTSSHASMAAKRSSSQHITTSDSSHRPVLIAMAEQQRHNRQLAEPLNNAAGPDGLSEVPDQSIQSSTGLQSPSASLLQINRLAAQPAKQQRQAAEDAEDEALWRRFVFGSDDAGSDPSIDIEMLRPTREAPSARRDTSPSLLISGLGTSDNATFGDTLFASQSVV